MSDWFPGIMPLLDCFVLQTVHEFLISKQFILVSKCCACHSCTNRTVFIIFIMFEQGLQGKAFSLSVRLLAGLTHYL
jgi:hypothetical protein